MRPRVGHIQFLNCLPLYYSMVEKNVLLDMELLKGTPMELNRYLIEGHLDVGPISSIEYARHRDKLVLLPDLTVSSDGEVHSIVLASTLPAMSLGNASVAMTNTSATSQALVQIILQQGYGVHPRYFVCPPDLALMLREAEAALLIGDQALRVSFEKPDLFVYDMGGEWKKLTNHKMVYAVWAARREFVREKPEQVRALYAAFQESLQYSLENLESIAGRAAKWEPFDAPFLFDYFRHLHFGFEPDYQAGLLHFYRRAVDLGFLKEMPALEFVDVR